MILLFPQKTCGYTLIATLAQPAYSLNTVSAQPAGDIPLIAHETDVYKLSGASTSRITDTEAEFNAGTLTNAVVLPDVATPAAPIINGAGGSGSFTGDYYAKVTFVDASGAESEQSVATSKLTLAGVTGISWSSIPTGGATIMQRKLYRTKTNGSIYYLAGTIDDNTTTTFADTVADASLTVLHPGIRRVILDPGKEKKVCSHNYTNRSRKCCCNWNVYSRANDNNSSWGTQNLFYIALSVRHRNGRNCFPCSLFGCR